MSRFHGLDALRGVAALLVLAQHILSLLALQGHGWAGAIITTVDLGKLGVSLFFLISGFVIPFSFRGSVRDFAIGRAARLLPALWLSILFCLALGAELHSPAHLFANAFMLTHLFGQPNLSDPYWTLSWEMYFYAIVALLFAMGRIHSPRAFGLLAVLTALASGALPKLTYLLFMFVGTLLRMVLIEKNEEAKRWLCAAFGALIGACVAWASRGTRPDELFAGLALSLPILLVFWNRTAHPALLWLGGVSYSLYLFHLPILNALMPLGLHPLVFAGLGTLLTLAVAAVVYRWIEKPMISYGRALARRGAGDRTRDVTIAVRSSAAS